MGFFPLSGFSLCVQVCQGGKRVRGREGEGPRGANGRNVLSACPSYRPALCTTAIEWPLGALTGLITLWKCLKYVKQVCSYGIAIL